MSRSGYEVVYPCGGSHNALGRVQRALRPALVPASWLYASVSDTLRRVRALERTPTPPGVTVISVGNLEVGGSGKTPLCIHLLERCQAAGKPVAYVSRGFASRAERFDGVTMVAPPMAPAAGVRWTSRDTRGLAAEIGDEGALVAERIPLAVLAFSRDKSRAVDLVAPMVAGGCVVMDDAFQSWGVARDIDVVLLGASDPFGDGWLLPAGSLREAPAAIERADVVLFNGATDEASLEKALEEIRRVTGMFPRWSTIRREVSLSSDAALPVVVVSAIARPDAFESSLQGRGVEIARALRFPDHHRYSAADVELILGPDGAAGRRLVVTEKDWVKLRDCGVDAARVIVARLEVHLDDDLILPKQ